MNPPPTTSDDSVQFTLQLARALHEAGYATNQLEEMLTATSKRLGVDGQFFATPTSIFASFGQETQQLTFMIRTEPRPPDLGRLARVAGIAREVLHGATPPAEGRRRLAAAIPSTTPNVLFVLGYGFASASAAHFLGGGWAEARVAGLAGIAIGLLALLGRRWTGFGRIFEPLAAFICALGVALLDRWAGTYSVPVATLAGLIVLVPGLTVTNAIAELATGHLSAGTARMASAFMTFIGIGFGVAMGYRIAANLGHPIQSVTPVAAGSWTRWAALVGAALSFAILLKVPWRDTPWIVAAGLLAFLATRTGNAVLGPQLGAFAGALAVALGSNAYNRLTDRPSAVTQVPALLILVPGSIGFRSISALLESQVVSGIGTAFNMLLTAMALVAGLLVAAAIVPEKPPS